VVVDYVWGARTLPELVSGEAPFDWVLASHVIEHVPDLIGWLREVSTILRPHGVLSLAIPDKRYCFDHYRQPTITAEAVEAYLQRQRRPSFRQIFDHVSSFATLGGSLTWTRGRTAFRPGGTIQEALDIAGSCRRRELLRRALLVFTPASFSRLMASLVELNLFDFLLDGFFPTAGHEFFVSLTARRLRQSGEHGCTAQASRPFPRMTPAPWPACWAGPPRWRGGP
jgi:SAM-dependent methyltransferase